MSGSFGSRGWETEMFLYKRRSELGPVSAMALVLITAGVCCLGCSDPGVARLTLEKGAPVRQLFAADALGKATPVADLIEQPPPAAASVDPEYQFYRPRGVDLDSAGNAYVLDDGNHRIQVFGPDGDYLRTIGRQGQGPGELGNAWGIAIAGSDDVVIVHDQGNHRLSQWDRDGAAIGSSPTSLNLMSPLFGLRDGTLLGLYSTLDPELFSQRRGFYRATVSRVDRSGVEIRRYVGGEVQLEPLPVGMPRIASDRRERLYFAPYGEFAISAINLDDGNDVWHVEFVDDDGLVLTGELGEQPVRNLAVDDHGHVWVWTPRTDPSGAAYPVVVLSAEGELISSGSLAISGFNASRGDDLYRLARDPDTEEVNLRRYTLVERFEP